VRSSDKDSSASNSGMLGLPFAAAVDFSGRSAEASRAAAA
jgi:hypothetical protein